MAKYRKALISFLVGVVCLKEDGRLIERSKRFNPIPKPLSDCEEKAVIRAVYPHCTGPTAYHDENQKCRCGSGAQSDYIYDSLTLTCINCRGPTAKIINGKCECENNYQLSYAKDKCILCYGFNARVNSQNECECDQELSWRNVGGECTCQHGYLLAKNQTSCVKCSGANGILDSRDQCHCRNPETYLINSGKNKCVRCTGPGSWLNNSDQCYCSSTGTKLYQDTCICEQGFLLSKGKNKCIQCINGELVDDQCTCHKDMMINNDHNECIRCNGRGFMLIDDECRCKDNFIMDYGTSVNGECICGTGMMLTADHTECKPCSGPGALLFLNNNQCYCPDTGTKLLQNTCICDEGFLLNDNENKCIQCINGILEDDACTCRKDMIMNKDHNKCIQCNGLGTMLSTDDKCNCKENFILDTTATTCIPCANGTSVNGECTCDTRMMLTADHTTCKPCFGPGAKLTTSGQCACTLGTSLISTTVDYCILCGGDGAYLDNLNNCQCDEHSMLNTNNDTCVPCKGPGAFVDYQNGAFICNCDSKHHSNRDTPSNMCICDIDYILAVEINTCVKCKHGRLNRNHQCRCKSGSMINMESNGCVDCNGPGAFLNDDVCKCNSNLSLPAITGEQCIACSGPGAFINQENNCDCFYPSVIDNTSTLCECLNTQFQEYLLDEDTNTCVLCSNGYLENGDCKCNAGHLITENGMQCIQCDGIGATLDETDLCDCDPKTSILSSSFETCISCYGDGSVLNELDECECKVGFILSSTMTTCIPCEGPGAMVDQNNMCVCDSKYSNMTVEGVCSCSAGLLYLNDQCVPCTGPGSIIDQHGQCSCNTNFAQLVYHGQCSCLPGFIFNEADNSCIQCEGPGSAIDSNHNCRCNPAVSKITEEGLCSCYDDFLYDHEMNNCVHCFGSNTVLSEGKCSCNASYLLSSDNTHCITCFGRHASLNENDECKCGPFANFTINDGCQCTDGYLMDHSGYCIKCLSIDGYSYIDSTNQCACQDGSILNSTIGECIPCNGAHKIVSSNNECICNSSKYIMSESGQCINCHGEGSYLANNQCSCHDGFLLSDNNECIQCLGEGTFLDNGLCTCHENYKPVNLENTLGILDNCIKCFGIGSELDSFGKCTCQNISETQLLTEQSECIDCSGIGACLIDGECGCAGSAVLDGSLCKCDQNFLPSVEHTDCIECYGSGSVIDENNHCSCSFNGTELSANGTVCMPIPIYELRTEDENDYSLIILLWVLLLLLLALLLQCCWLYCYTKKAKPPASIPEEQDLLVPRWDYPIEQAESPSPSRTEQIVDRIGSKRIRPNGAPNKPSRIQQELAPPAELPTIPNIPEESPIIEPLVRSPVELPRSPKDSREPSIPKTTQSTNTDSNKEERQFSEHETQTSMPSLYSSNSDGTETPTALPCLIETPTPRIWGPIDSPVADVTNITSTSCDVSWNYQDNAVFYITSCIQMFSDVNDPQITRHSNETTKVRLTSLMPNKEYQILVTAFDIKNHYKKSQYIRFHTNGEAPGRPQRIIFQICSPNSIQVNWGEPPESNGNIKGYEVDYHPSSSNAHRTRSIFLQGRYKRSITIAKLEENVEYRYNVRAANEWGTGDVQTATMRIDPQGYYESPRSSIILGTTETPYQSLVDLRDASATPTSSTQPSETPEPTNQSEMLNMSTFVKIDTVEKTDTTHYSKDVSTHSDRFTTPEPKNQPKMNIPKVVIIDTEERNDTSQYLKDVTTTHSSIGHTGDQTNVKRQTQRVDRNTQQQHSESFADISNDRSLQESSIQITNLSHTNIYTADVCTSHTQQSELEETFDDEDEDKSHTSSHTSSHTALTTSDESSDDNDEYRIRCKTIEIDQVDNELEELQIQIQQLENDLRHKIDRQDLSENDICHYQSEILVAEQQIEIRQKTKSTLVQQLSDIQTCMIQSSRSHHNSECQILSHNEESYVQTDPKRMQLRQDYNPLPDDTEPYPSSLEDDEYQSNLCSLTHNTNVLKTKMKTKKKETFSKSFQRVDSNVQEISDDSSEAYVSSYQSDTDTHIEETRYLIGNYNQETAHLIDMEEQSVPSVDDRSPLIVDSTEHKSSTEKFRFHQSHQIIKTDKIYSSSFQQSDMASSRASREAQTFSVSDHEQEQCSLLVEQRMVAASSETAIAESELLVSRISTQSKSNSDIYHDVYQTNTLTDHYDPLKEDRYRKSTTEVYDAYNAARTKDTIYDSFQTDDLLQQGFASIKICEEHSEALEEHSENFEENSETLEEHSEEHFRRFI